MRTAPLGFAALALLAACSGGYALPGNDGGPGGPFTRDPPPPSRDTPPPSQDPPNQGSGGSACVIACDQTYACTITVTVNGQTQSETADVTFATVDGQCVETDDPSTIVQCDGTVLDVSNAGPTVLGRAQATGNGAFQLCASGPKGSECTVCAPTQAVVNPPQPGGALVDAG